MGAWARDKQTGENKNTIDGIIKIYSENVTVSETIDHNISFDIRSYPEAALYNNYKILEYAQYFPGTETKKIAPTAVYNNKVYPTCGIQIPNVNEEYVTVDFLNTTGAQETYKIEITVLWYND